MPLELPRFEIGKVYDRQRHIHARFGGQAQGGISTPASVPFVFLFTGESGEQYGYQDGWSDADVFLYTGEGQIGDMQFVRGNSAVRDHISNGEDLLLFQSLGKGKGYRYVGEFQCGSWEYRLGPDLKGQNRKVIVFHLVKPDADTEPSTVEESDVDEHSLEQLRRKALEASVAAPQTSAKNARQLYYQRSIIVKAYVLARANGKCESCKQAAPFRRLDGTPYLEPHHTRRLSDGGPDDPRCVAGICPTCHRRIHYGRDGQEVNDALKEHLSEIEAR
jgi:5-methylcytosine-specific restriction protein A